MNTGPGSGRLEATDGSWYLAGTFDNPSAAAAPYRFVPALIRARAD